MNAGLKTRTNLLLAGLVVLDIVLSGTCLFFPDLWFKWFHGVPYVDSAGPVTADRGRVGGVHPPAVRCTDPLAEIPALAGAGSRSSSDGDLFRLDLLVLLFQHHLVRPVGSVYFAAWQSRVRMDSPKDVGAGGKSGE